MFEATRNSTLIPCGKISHLEYQDANQSRKISIHRILPSSIDAFQISTISPKHDFESRTLRGLATGFCALTPEPAGVL